MAFQAIKVNFKNAKGKPSSTTVSYAIASFFALHSTNKTKLDDSDVIKIVQTAVNAIDANIYDDIGGHAKYTIETHLLNKVYYDYGLHNNKQLNLI